MIRAVWRCRHVLLVSTAIAATTTVEAAPLDAEAENYRPVIGREVQQSLDGARTLRERIAAGDLPGAQQAWIAARVGWERAEVFTSGFTSELDREIDSWPNAASGFHAIEAKLFGAHRLDIGPETDALVLWLTDLNLKARDTRLTGQGLLEGAAKLAYEVGESKAGGGESRFSGTSLDDMRNNVEGIALAYGAVFAAGIKAHDPRLDSAVLERLGQLRDALNVKSLAELDGDKVRTASEELIVELQRAAPLLGLDRLSMSDLIQQ